MLVTPLYNSTVQLCFDPARHRYTVDGEWVAGVTTILGAAINKSDALMPWAVKKCLEHIEANLLPDTPYSTTELDLIFQGARGAHRVFKEEAGAIGSMTHAWLEDYQRSLLHNTEPPPLPEDERVRNATQAPLEWMKEVQFTPLVIEHPIYSREWKFAGTLDGIAMIEGRKALFDWKTSSALYLSHAWQTAAYQAAWEEMQGVADIEGRYLLHLDKVNGVWPEEVTKFTDRESFERHWKAFQACCVVREGLREKMP